MKSSHILNSLLASTILLAPFVFLTEIPATSDTAQTTDKKQVFTDEDLKEEKMEGNLRLGVMTDLEQWSDPSVPVVVANINTAFGHSKYAGRVKVMEAKIKNRSHKLTQSIQLRWSIVSKEEGQPDTVLLEGLMPFMEAQIEPQGVPQLDIPPIYFNKIVKPLLKNGEISGVLRLVVGIQEVRFADGTTWRRTQ